MPRWRLPPKPRVPWPVASGPARCTANSRELTKNARAKFDQRFIDEVDPDRVLPESERLRRAEHARKAYFTRLALLSAKARKRRKLLRVVEIAEILGVSKQRADQLRREPDFPAPVDRWARRNLWAAADVGPWRANLRWRRSAVGEG
jgi:predicted DNA-binding transcriptional regulator AlpA